MQAHGRLRPSHYTGVLVACGLALLPLIAAADVTLPAACTPISSDTQSNIDYLTNPNTNFNAMLGNLDNISSRIFESSGRAALFIAGALGTIETTWFIINTIVLKHNVDEILREMFFKLLTVSFILSLIIGLMNNGGSAVKSLSISFFAALANQSTSDLIPSTSPYDANVNLNGPTDGTKGGPGQQMQSASNGIITTGLSVADAIVNCPAKLYASTHPPSGNSFTDGFNNVVTTIKTIPFQIDAIFFAGLVMLVFAAMDFLLVATMIDGLLVLSVGIILLGFANSRWTSDNAASYFRLLFAVGWKVFSYIFIANLGSVLIYDTVANELNSFQMTPFDFPAFPPGGIAGLAVVLLLIVVLTLFASSISKALSSGNFQVGMAGGALRTLVDLRLLSMAAGGAFGGPGGAAAAGKASNAITKPGGGSDGPSSNGRKSPQIPNSPIGISRVVSGGIDHETSGAGINFRPHG